MSFAIDTCPLQDDLNDITEKKKPEKMRASIFFDGTGNNRDNTNERLANTELYKSRYFFAGSYENDISNIAKLEQYVMEKSEGFDHHIKEYIDGIGTISLGRDSLIGQALGIRDTGVIGKVKISIDRLISAIVSRASADKLIENLKIDVFGFSRGAAAARYFVYCAMENPKTKVKDALESKGFTVSNIEIGFVGLFDTVASFGYDITNDTKELHLDSIKIASKVIHLVAADEYRAKFPVTNIKGSGGKEILLPGAHSDIGGGYTDDMAEERIMVSDFNDTNDMGVISDRMGRDKQWLIEQGWYREEDLMILPGYIIASRAGIKNTYSLIPLHIMKKHAIDTALTFSPDIDFKEKIPENMMNLHKLKKILGDYGDGSWVAETELLRKIRYRYFHFSSTFASIGMQPNYGTDRVKRVRQIYDGVLTP